MKYLLLITEPRGQRLTRNEDEARGLYDEMVRFGAELADEGHFIASESLRPDEHAVRVTTAEGKVRVHDGPFAEAKEMVGGFYLLEVENRDQAVAIAARCPAARWATVEVRECAPCYVK